MATNKVLDSIERDVEEGIRIIKNTEIAIVGLEESSPELDRIRRVINVEGVRPKGRERDARSIGK